MRIGIDLVSDNGQPSGIHSYTNCLLEGLLDGMESAAVDGCRDWELVIFHHDDFQWSFPIEERGRVELVKTGFRNLSPIRRRLLQQRLVPGLARQHRVHLVHSLNNVLPLKLEVPGVVTVHDLSPFVIPKRFGFMKRRFLRWAVPRSITSAAAVIAISENTRNEILRRVPATSPGKIHTLHNGIDERFHPERNTAAEVELAKKYNLPGSFLLYVGAAEPGKNLQGICNALEILKSREGVDIPWVIVGTQGSYAQTLEKKWRHSTIARNIHSLGLLPAEDVKHLYRMARAFVFPSIYEGFGLPLLEAFASGTPAVTSGGDSALGEVAGRAALTVAPHDVEDVARGILRIWSHREVRELLRLRGRRRILDFSWKANAARTLEIYGAVGAAGSGESHTSSDRKMGSRVGEKIAQT